MKEVYNSRSLNVYSDSFQEEFELRINSMEKAMENGNTERALRLNPNKSIDAKTLAFNYANIFAGNVEEVLVNLLDKNGYEETFRLLNLDYIVTFLNEDNEVNLINDQKDTELIIREKKRQEQDEKDMDIICCFDDARKWYSQCESLI